jgi:hypothetical protein
VPNGDPTNYSLYGVVNASDPMNTLAIATKSVTTLYEVTTSSIDVRFSKNIHFKEKYNVQLFFQAFNLTNRANYGNNFFNTPNSTSFMQPAGFINPSSTSIPRSFNGEFGFRFTF